MPKLLEGSFRSLPSAMSSPGQTPDSLSYENQAFSNQVLAKEKVKSYFANQPVNDAQSESDAASNFDF